MNELIYGLVGSLAPSLCGGFSLNRREHKALLHALDISHGESLPQLQESLDGFSMDLVLEIRDYASSFLAFELERPFPNVDFARLNIHDDGNQVMDVTFCIKASNEMCLVGQRLPYVIGTFFANHELSNFLHIATRSISIEKKSPSLRVNQESRVELEENNGKKIFRFKHDPWEIREVVLPLDRQDDFDEVVGFLHEIGRVVGSYVRF